MWFISGVFSDGRYTITHASGEVRIVTEEELEKYNIYKEKSD